MTGDALQPSSIPPDTEVIVPHPGRYPSEEWTTTYFDVDRQGGVTPRRVRLRVPAGLGSVCPEVPPQAPGPIYGVRRWGLALRPSVLEWIDFDPRTLAQGQSTEELLAVMLQVVAFDLPGEFVIASPEHPLRLFGPDGRLRGSGLNWRTYLGALAFFASSGRVDASFIRLWHEFPESYAVGVEECLAVLAGAEAPGDWPGEE